MCLVHTTLRAVRMGEVRRDVLGCETRLELLEKDRGKLVSAEPVFPLVQLPHVASDFVKAHRFRRSSLRIAVRRTRIEREEQQQWQSAFLVLWADIGRFSLGKRTAGALTALEVPAEKRSRQDTRPSIERHELVKHRCHDSVLSAHTRTGRTPDAEERRWRYGRSLSANCSRTASGRGIRSAVASVEASSTSYFSPITIWNQRSRSRTTRYIFSS